MCSSDLLKVKIETEGAVEIARRSRGTPRIANRMLKRVRDWAQVRADGVITQAVADRALQEHGVDMLGLDDLDRRYLSAIVDKYAGGPVGLETLSSILGEERDTLEDVHEPYLMQIGFINRTGRGRMATRAAYSHLGMVYPEKEGETPQGKLF